MKGTEVIKMLLDIDLAVDKRLAIKEKICEILDEMEKAPDTFVMTQDSIKIGKTMPPDAETKEETKPPEDEPQKLLRSKEVIGKTNRGGGEEYIRHREADGTAFGGMVHKGNRGRDEMHRADD